MVTRSKLTIFFGQASYLSAIGILFLFYPLLSIQAMSWPSLMITNIEDIILSNGHAYYVPDIQNYTKMLYLAKSNSIYVVGSRNTLIRITADTLKFQEKVKLSYNKQYCEHKHQCKVILEINLLERVFNDQFIWYCSYLKVLYKNIPQSVQVACKIPWIKQINRFHYQFMDNSYTSTNSNYRPSVVTSKNDNGFIYIGAFSNHHWTISRLSLSRNGDKLDNSQKLVSAPRKPIITGQGDLIESFQSQDSIYFVIKETSQRLCYPNGRNVASIVRICKGDPGGPTNDTQGYFSTLAKATLVCKVPGSDSSMDFYYTDLSSAYWYDENLYAVFTTERYAPLESVVCVYSLEEINNSFNGPVQSLTRKSLPIPNMYPNMCSRIHNGNLPSRTLFSLTKFAMKYVLRNKSITSRTGKPLASLSQTRWEHIVVHKTRRAVVVYLASSSEVFKMVSNAVDAPLCLVHIYRLGRWGARKEQETMNSIQIQNGHIFMTTSKQVLKFPLALCPQHLSKTSCIEAEDPFCGWSKLQKQCVPADNNIQIMQSNFTPCIQRIQRIKKYSHNKKNQNSAVWSDWITCKIKKASSYYFLPEPGVIGPCKCRYCQNRRKCDVFQQITNCTVNGGWTSWTPWSPCSRSCGLGYRQRFRFCQNPTPSKYGKPCGLHNNQVQKITCSMRRNCRVLGEWSNWSSWEPCTDRCQPSVQKRTRSCPLGYRCIGSELEQRLCDTKRCSDYHTTSEWTQWLSKADKEGGGILQKRFQFVCSSRHEYAGLMEVTKIVTEKRHCKNNLECNSGTLEIDQNGGWTAWSRWSSCSRSCGSVGTRRRSRSCTQPPPQGRHAHYCLGYSAEYQTCNGGPCMREDWSCWSDWSVCSPRCDNGYRNRTRKCISHDFNVCSKGEIIQKERCRFSNCVVGKHGSQYWKSWVEWSRCNSIGLHVRRRECLQGYQCYGEIEEYKACSKDEQVPGNATEYFSIIHVILIGIVSSLVSFLIVAVIFCACHKHKRVNLSRQCHRIKSTVPIRNTNELCPIVTQQTSFSNRSNHNNSTLTDISQNCSFNHHHRRRHPHFIDHNQFWDLSQNHNGINSLSSEQNCFQHNSEFTRNIPVNIRTNRICNNNFNTKRKASRTSRPKRSTPPEMFPSIVPPRPPRQHSPSKSSVDTNIVPHRPPRQLISSSVSSMDTNLVPPRPPRQVSPSVSSNDTNFVPPRPPRQVGSSAVISVSLSEHLRTTTASTSLPQRPPRHCSRP